MDTHRVSAESTGWLAQVREVLDGGGLVAFPTDTVYGLGTRAFDGEAIERIYRAKDRPAEKAIPVLVASWEEACRVVVPTPELRRLAAAFWPGPLTVVGKRLPELPLSIGPLATVGVRAPGHPVALELLRAVGPLATSSANRSGGPSRTTADEVLADLGGRIDLLVDGGVTPGGRPSTVVDCTGPEPVLVREGPVSLEQVLAVWAG